MSDNDNDNKTQDNRKECLGCGRRFPKTPEHFPGSTKSGTFRPRSRCHDCTAAQKMIEAEARAALNESYGPAQRKGKWVTPPNLALGKAGQFRTCGEGQGLNVLMGPGNAPVIRGAGGRFEEWEVCIVLG